MAAAYEVEHYDESVEDIGDSVDEEVEVRREDYDWKELDHHLRVEEVYHPIPCVPCHQYFLERRMFRA